MISQKGGTVHDPEGECSYGGNSPPHTQASSKAGTSNQLRSLRSLSVLTVGIASLLYQEHVPGLSIVLAGYGSVLLHSGADAYIVVSVGSFVTGVVFTLLGIRYRQYKALHRPFSPDAADKASSQSLSDDQ